MAKASLETDRASPVTLWVYRDGRQNDGALVGLWRGEYDQKTRECLVSGPENFKGHSVPRQLREALRREFGTGLVIFYFDKRKIGKRIK